METRGGCNDRDDELQAVDAENEDGKRGGGQIVELDA